MRAAHAVYPTRAQNFSSKNFLKKEFWVPFGQRIYLSFGALGFQAKFFWEFGPSTRLCIEVDVRFALDLLQNSVTGGWHAIIESWGKNF